MKKLIVILLFSVTHIYSQLITPLEKSDYKTLTSNKDVINFVIESSKYSNFIEIDTLAISHQNRIIPVVKISNSNFSKNNKKVRVLIFAQQHGNEQSGKEAALLLLKQICLEKLNYLFDNIDLLLIPQMNPDGNEKDKRRNGNDIDLNRNHLILTEPEVIGLHNLFNKYLPEVTIDIHEYYPYSNSWVEFEYLKNYDEQIGLLTNPNIYQPILRFQKEKVLPFLEHYLSKDGYSYNEYMVGGPPNKKLLRFSTVDINDGRQSFGILNTLSFIIEGKNGKNSLENIKYRSEAQYSAIVGFLEFINENSNKIKNLVSVGRKSLIENQQNSLSIQMDHINVKSKEIPFYSLQTKKDTLLNLSNFHSKIESKFLINKPLGYLISITDTNIISLLQNHNVVLEKYSKPTNHILYEYFIKKIYKENLEGLDVNLTEVKKNELIEIDYSNYLYVSLDIIQSNMLVLMLEPQSMSNLLQYEKFSYLLKENFSYPILRVEAR